MNTLTPLKIRRLFKTLLAAIALLSALAAQTQATIIVGNSNPDDDFGGAQIGHVVPPLPINQGFAAGFTMPGQDYTLTDVLLRLSFYDGPSEAAVGIYLDNAGLPGSPFATLIDPAAVSDPADYTFLPSGTVTLAANTKYWLVVTADPGSQTDDAFEWIGAFDSPMGVATFNEYAASQNGGVTWTALGGFNLRFTINGEQVVASVPDGGSTAMLLCIGLLAFVFASRHLRQAASAARATSALR